MNECPETTFAVANRFLELAQESLRPIIHMKLQKLVYFAHGWHLALLGQPLVNEKVRARRFGPIFESIYHEFLECGNTPIDRYAKRLCYVGNDELKLVQSKMNGKNADGLIERIWEIYDVYTHIQLANLAHAHDTPWARIASQYPSSLDRWINIPDELILEHFKKFKQIK